MAKPVVDISIFGDKELERILAQELPRKQTAIVATAMRKGMRKVLQPAIMAVVPVDTGNLRNAMAANLKVRTVTLKDFARSIQWALPTRAMLNLPAHKSAEDEGYYPTSVEYGHKTPSGGWVPPKSYIRAPVNANTERYLAMVKTEIFKGIERAVARRAKGT